MIPDVLYTLLVPLLIVLGGIILVLLGWLIVTSARARASRAAVARAMAGESPEAEPAPESSSASEVAPATQHASVPVPFIAAEPTKDGWVIFVQGKRYGDLEDVPDRQVRAEVISALRAMAGFARAYMANQQRQASPPPPRPAAPPQPPTQERPASVPATPLTSRLSHPASPGGSSATATPRETLESQTRRVTAPDAMIPTIDFAHEISAIVDELMGQAPELQGHSVRLTNLPGGGISFAVDGKVYREIDEIPDPAVRDLIRRATREWERR